MKGYFIGFGLNHVDPLQYQGWNGELRAAENDVQSYSEIAQKKGYKSVATLLGQSATRENVRKAFRETAMFAASGDIVFVAYSGHGNQYKKGSKLYESYCLYDGQLAEQEIRNMIAAFREGVRVLMILDCCHAGGFDRDMLMASSNLDNEYIAKSMPKDVSIMLDSLDAQGELAHKKPLQIKGKLVKWLTACDKKQVALDGKKHGLFTTAVLKTIEDKEVISYADVYKNVLEMCQPYQKPQLKNTHKVKFDDNEVIFKI